MLETQEENNTQFWGESMAHIYSYFKDEVDKF